MLNKLNQTQKDNHISLPMWYVKKKRWAKNIKVKEKLLGMYMGKGKRKGR